MALKIRLRRMGRKKAPHYRIVVAESTMPRDGRFVATVGHYNPTTTPTTLVVDREKALSWLGRGAKPTETVYSLLKKAGVYSEQPEGVEAVAAAVTGAVSGAASAATEAVKDAAEAVKDAAETAVEAVTERVAGGEPEAEAAAPAEEAGAPEAAQQDEELIGKRK